MRTGYFPLHVLVSVVGTYVRTHPVPSQMQTVSKSQIANVNIQYSNSINLLANGIYVYSSEHHSNFTPILPALPPAASQPQKSNPEAMEGYNVHSKRQILGFSAFSSLWTASYKLGRKGVSTTGLKLPSAASWRQPQKDWINNTFQHPQWKLTPGSV